MPQRFPFVARVQPGEAPLSVLRRAALGNGYHSTLSFVHGLEPHIDPTLSGLASVARDPALFIGVAVRAGIEREAAAGCAYRRLGAARKDDLLWQGLRVGVGDLQFRHPKLCVACYLKEGFAHAEWDHVAAHACARHGVLLEAACPVCGQAWSPLFEPLSCGCDPARMLAAQIPCSREEATLMSSLISKADQAGLDLLSALHRAVQDWRDLGVSLSRRTHVTVVTELFRGAGLPAACIEGNESGDALHPRVALAPLLADASVRIRRHAERLLESSMPRLPARLDPGLTWSATMAMAALGIGRLALNILVRAGFLSPTGDQRVPVAQVNALLHRAAKQVASDFVNPLQALRASYPRTTLAAALRGRTGAASRQRQHCGDTTSDGETYTIQTAARALGTNSEAIRGLAHAGLLQATRGNACSTVRWVITAEDLATFDRDFAFGAALAGSIGASATTFSSRLRSYGVKPISGPGIDSGIAYVFRRRDLEGVDLRAVATTPYRSPAGRRRAADRSEEADILSTRDTARMLGVPVRRVRTIVDEGWISPRDPKARALKFDADAVQRLAERIRADYRRASALARSLGQSTHEFKATWLDTGYVTGRMFAGALVLSEAHAASIEALWETLATGGVIGRALGRERWLCTNLRKQNLMKPQLTLGSGATRVYLYRRCDPLLVGFKTRPT